MFQTTSMIESIRRIVYNLNIRPPSLKPHQWLFCVSMIAITVVLCTPYSSDNLFAVASLIAVYLLIRNSNNTNLS